MNNEIKNIHKLIDDIYYHRITHEQIIPFVDIVHKQLLAE